MEEGFSCVPEYIPVPCYIHVHAGTADAQFSLGQYHYRHGNYVDALKLFGMAEAGGNTQAKYQLGVMHYDGVGVGEDMVRMGGGG